jgi:hypothetical protein
VAAKAVSDKTTMPPLRLHENRWADAKSVLVPCTSEQRKKLKVRFSCPILLRMVRKLSGAYP